MSAASTVTLAALLLAVFLVLVAGLVWQEAKRRPGSEAPAYIVEDSVDFIADRIRGATTLTRADVKRIIEWNLFYLQGLAQRQRWRPVETVAGGSPEAVDFIHGRIAERHQVSYPLDEIRRVLELEAEYLHSIGVVGEPVEGQDEYEGGDEA